MDEKLMICIHYGYTNSVKCLIPSIGYNLGISLNDPEFYTKIISVIKTNKIEKLYLDGTLGVIQEIAFNLTTFIPDINIEIKNLED